MSRFHLLQGIPVLLLAISAANADSIQLPSEPALNPSIASQFTLTTVASGLNFPTAMAIAPNGSLLVATTLPSGDLNDENLYSGQGQLLDMVNGTLTTVASFPGAITGVTTVGSDVVVATTGDHSSSSYNTANIYVLSAGQSGYQQLAQLNFVYPNGGGSPNIAVAASGNGFDFSLTHLSGTVDMSGALSGTLVDGSIYSVQLNSSSGALSQPALLADNVRNTDGMAVDSSGNLYFGDNGTEPPDACAPDQVNEIAASAIGVYDAGFQTPEVPPCQPATGLIASFPGGPSGIAGLAMSPFSGQFAGDLFVGFDGNYNTPGSGNTTDPVIALNPATGAWEDLIPAGQPGECHPVGLLSTAGVLYVSELNCNYDSTQPSDQQWQGNTGLIYAITQDAASTPEPGSLWLAGIMLLLAAKTLFSAASPWKN